MPKFSIIVPSYLGSYKHAAKERGKKIHRAIESALAQTYTDFDINIICDGCYLTWDAILNAPQYKEHLETGKINCWMIAKQPMMSGKVRNFGIYHSTGKWIVYLDIDDTLGKNHLAIINQAMFEAEQIKKEEPDWVWFNDNTWQKKTSTFAERICDIKKKHQHGTSNVAHKKSLNVFWKYDNYDHDFLFIKELLQHPNHTKIKTPEYYVHHIPNQYDI